MDKNGRQLFPRTLIFRLWIIICILFAKSWISKACVFPSRHLLESESEGVRFIRIREDLPVGGEVLTLQAYPRNSVLLKSMERSSDHSYFKLRDVNSTTIQVLLDKSLEDLVDRDTPQNLLKFKILCSSSSSEVTRNEEQSSFMTITIYIEDINDHFPTFLNLPYEVEIDELTPVGSTVFQNIVAFDRDKPNTPNSDIQYSLGAVSPTKESAYFALESRHRPSIVLKKPLDFDEGIRIFLIDVIASDRGTPARSSNTTLRIIVKDNDDLPPKFTETVYRSKINEFSPLTGKHVRIPLYFDPPIFAFDQDSMNVSLTYDIIAGNERRLFLVNPNSGMIFLEKEIDLEEESLPANTFVLQLEARQNDNPQRRSVSRIEIEILDLNDNPPEFEVDLYNISIVENLPTGFSVLQVNAFDRDQSENAEFYYSIVEEIPPGAFSIDSRTGWITVKEQALLDRESRGSIMMIVKAIEKHPPHEKRALKDGSVRVDITLLDSNDNTPEFDRGNLYEFKVSINAKLGDSIGHVHAKDPDEGRNGLILYDLQKPRGLGTIPFKVDPQNGSLHVSGPLRQGRLALFVEASDQPNNPSERRFSLAVVTIEIVREDILGSVDFIGAPYEFWIGEDVPIGTSVGQIKTTMEYEQQGEQIMYDLLHSYSDGVPFAVEERTGTVTVIRSLSEFTRILYEFEAVATYHYNDDGHWNRKTPKTQKNVSSIGVLMDVNERTITGTRSVLLTNVTVHVVSPEDDKGTLIRGTSSDPIVFRIKENLAGAKIGQLIYNRNLTRSKEKSQPISSNPMIFGPRKNRQMSSTKFNINDTQFTNPLRNKRNNQELSHGGFYVPIAPSIVYEDLDCQQSTKDYEDIDRKSFSSIEKSNSSTGFRAIRIPRSMDRPVGDKSYEGSHALRKRLRQDREMKALNRSPRPPIQSSKPTYRSIGRVRLTMNETNSKPEKSHNDNTSELRFLIANQQDVTGLITITNDGTLMTVKGLDREERDIYRLIIIAEYTSGHLNAAGIYQVTIYVDDENDNPPNFNYDSFSGVIQENSPIGTEIIMNKAIIVNDRDTEANADFEIYLSGEGSHLFKIDLINGTGQNVNKSFMTSFDTFTSAMNSDQNSAKVQMMFMDAAMASTITGPHYIVRYVGPTVLDRERQDIFNLKIIARDKGLLSSEVKLAILVADVNDNQPIFEKIAIFTNSGIRVLENTNDMEIYFVDHFLFQQAGNRKNNMSKSEIPSNLDIFSDYEMEGLRNTRTFPGSHTGTGNRGQAKFDRASPLFAIMENSTIGNAVMKLTASDEDDSNIIFYDIVLETCTARKINGRNTIANALPSLKYFNIDRISGEIRVNTLLPAESEIRLNVSARDLGNLTDYTEIRFRVIDVNDHSPVFSKPWYSFDIEEGVYKYTRVGRVEATDEDFGQNANVTYKFQSHMKHPFVISPISGVITINGDVDRELQSNYDLKVIATDNSDRDYRLSAHAKIEITILDLNDNTPEFMDFDELLTDSNSTAFNQIIFGDNSNRISGTPVYKAYISRHTEPGTFVKQAIAVDKDFPGNGNGLVMYSLHYNEHVMPHLFEIDSRDGIITTVASLNSFQGYDHVNLTIIASDLGSPPKSSAALLLINLQGEDVGKAGELYPPNTVIIQNQYYEIDVLENMRSPIKILQLNVSKSYGKDKFRWSIAPEIEMVREGIITVDENMGTLWVTSPLDREEQDYYQFRIRAERMSREGRNHPPINVNYPAEGSKVRGLADNEARVVIHVADENDNSPVFVNNGRPIVAVIPNTANFGHPVTRVMATDLDLGDNAEIRYSLLNEPSKMFGIDPISGSIRILGPVIKDGDRVYGFDVKAVDKKGADDGKSSITNVFVYVLDENRQVKLVISGLPVEVEKELHNLTEALSDATTLDIRVRMLEPHEGDPAHLTDVYLYAVDPKSNSVIDMEQLQNELQIIDLANLAVPLPIVEVSQLDRLKSPARSNFHENVLNGPELATIILSVIILAGGLATALCIACVRYKRRRRVLSPETIGRASSSVHTSDSKSSATYITEAHHAKPTPLWHTTATVNSASSLHLVIPSTHTRNSSPVPVFGSNNNITYTSIKERKYIDVPLPKAVLGNSMLSGSTTDFNNIVDHDSTCLRFNHAQEFQPSINIDQSGNSIHSSGRDSGLDLARERSESPSTKLAITLQNKQHHLQNKSLAQSNERREIYTKCICRANAFNVMYNGESSDSYEDSLKGVPVSRRKSLPKSSAAFRRSIRKNGAGTRHSFSGVRDDLIQQSPAPLHRMPNGQLRNSITDLEKRLRNLERTFRDPYAITNSHC